MQNTYQNKIVDIQSKKPPIFSKLEGGKSLKLKAILNQPETNQQLLDNWS